jgi:hypothetical protein
VVVVQVQETVLAVVARVAIEKRFLLFLLVLVHTRLSLAVAVLVVTTKLELSMEQVVLIHLLLV